jgi:RNA polymerase sigma-70 factor (ECF subfamily)
MPTVFSTMTRPLHALPDLEDVSSPFEKDAEHLLFLVGQQDRRALQTLYEWWSPSLLGIAMRIMRDREEAEEAMQDTFVKLWHRAAEYDAGKSKAFVWCFTILRSICLDRIRYHRRQKRDHKKNLSPDQLDIPEPQFDPRILGSDTITAVRAAVNQLPDDERRCLELAVFLEYTQSEISDELQTPLGTVKHRLRRAMAKLQSMLSYHELTR